MAKEGATLHTEFVALGEVVLENDRKRLKLNSTAHYQQCLNHLAIGTKVHATFSTKQTTRSTSQLEYYWVLMGYLSDATGYTKEEMHDLCVRAKFGTKTVTVGGITAEVRRSIANVAKMPKYECVELIEFALDLCNQENIHVPTKEELGYLPD